MKIKKDECIVFIIWACIGTKKKKIQTESRYSRCSDELMD